MYARLTTLKAKPDLMDEMASRIPIVKPLLKSITGLVSNVVVWRADGSCVIMAVYESQAAADAATQAIESILADMAEYLATPPQIEIYENAEDMLA